MVSLKKQESPPTISTINNIENVNRDEVDARTYGQKRYCPECRWYAVSGAVYIGFLGGFVLPAIFLIITKPGNIEGLIILGTSIITATLITIAYIPYAIAKADKQFEDMNYHSHIHMGL
jgi:hypothetical protein